MIKNKSNRLIIIEIKKNQSHPARMLSGIFVMEKFILFNITIYYSLLLL